VHKRKRIRYSKMTRTRQVNALTKTNIVEFPIDKRRIIVCSNTLEDSSIVVEKRVGYKVTCSPLQLVLDLAWTEG
jgi:hypothetical protein